MAKNTNDDSPKSQPMLSSNSKQLQSSKHHNFPFTEKLYMSSSEGNYVTECTARLLHVEVGVESSSSHNNEQSSSLNNSSNSNKNNDSIDVSSSIITIILDRTILYAQGGGQPSDHGTIILSITTTKATQEEEEVSETVFITIYVTKVILERETGIVRHYGTIQKVDSQKATTPAITIQHQVELQKQYIDNKCCTDDEVDVNRMESTMNPPPIGKDQESLKHGFCLLQAFRQQQQQQQQNNSTTCSTKVMFCENVQVFVDPTIRQLHSECHTVGHVVDAAMERCGYNLIAGKGYHYLDGPYVEYIGTIGTNDKTNSNKDAIVKELQTAFRTIIQESIETKIHIVSKDVAMELCTTNNQDRPDMNAYADPITGLVRIVTIANLSCPCGGTHISNTSHLQNWDIISIKTKKGCVRVRYGQKQK